MRPVSATVKAIVRDMFLEGKDDEALATLFNEWTALSVKAEFYVESDTPSGYRSTPSPVVIPEHVGVLFFEMRNCRIYGRPTEPHWFPFTVVTADGVTYIRLCDAEITPRRIEATAAQSGPP